MAYMLVAYADGTAGARCGDSNGVFKVGDFKTLSIDAVWNGVPLLRSRGIHTRREFSKLPVCRDRDLTYPFFYWVRCSLQAHLRKLRG